MSTSAQNHAPTASNDAYEVVAGATLNVPAPGVLANDSDPDNNSLTAKLVTPPTNGAVNFNADGSFAYTPSLNHATESTLVDGNLLVLLGGNPQASSSLYGDRGGSAMDGSTSSLWYTAAGDAVNEGKTPFWEVLLAIDATVHELRMFVNDTPNSFLSGVFQLFDANDMVLFNSGDVVLPPRIPGVPVQNITIPVSHISGVRRVRFTATADQSSSPGFSELEVIGSAFAPQFQPKVEWSWTSSPVLPSSLNVNMTPAVVDLNRDGVPDVVFGSTSSRSGQGTSGVLRALDGATGHELFTVTDPTLEIGNECAIAVGDVDNNGTLEIIACDPETTKLRIFEHDGTLKRQSETIEAVRWGGIAIADLDQDGTSEIIVGRQVLNNDGTLRWTGTSKQANSQGYGPLSIVADVNLDGRLEIVAGPTVYRTDTASNGILGILWDLPISADGFNAVGNFDEDPFPEIVLVTPGSLYLLEHDGQVKWGSVSIPGTFPVTGLLNGPPTVADFDGDGKPEIGVAARSNYTVFETDGSVKWTTPIWDDSSGFTGSSVFDFEGDGVAEVVFRDQEKLRVYRGTDGLILFQTPMSSCTWQEYMFVADVDADNHAEIVATANESCAFGPQKGIFILGDVKNKWVSTRKVWNQHTYHITNVNEDGTIPRVEQNNWLLPGLNNFRLNAFSPMDQPRTDSFTYKASDGSLDSNVATVHLTINSANHPPVITSQPIPNYILPSGVGSGSSVILDATIRDLLDSHPDFEKGISGVVPGLVSPTLGADHKPVFVAPNGSGAISRAASFNQWYNDVDGINKKTVLPLVLNETSPGSKIFSYSSGSFFPIDGQLFGNQGYSHNYHFTVELHTTFTYHGGEVFQFTGDDDI